ncbi:hypothetical protein GCM10012319_66290 [Comamonas sp. KCTC 72670]|nr:hypothetical protein GCM10012319_66290 [Comamonas sp. KCTC 72670]
MRTSITTQDLVSQLARPAFRAMESAAKQLGIRLPGPSLIQEPSPRSAPQDGAIGQAAASSDSSPTGTGGEDSHVEARLEDASVPRRSADTGTAPSVVSGARPRDRRLVRLISHLGTRAEASAMVHAAPHSGPSAGTELGRQTTGPSAHAPHIAREGWQEAPSTGSHTTSTRSDDDTGRELLDTGHGAASSSPRADGPHGTTRLEDSRSLASTHGGDGNHGAARPTASPAMASTRGADGNLGAARLADSRFTSVPIGADGNHETARLAGARSMASTHGADGNHGAARLVGSRLTASLPNDAERPEPRSPSALSPTNDDAPSAQPAAIAGIAERETRSNTSHATPLPVLDADAAETALPHPDSRTSRDASDARLDGPRSVPTPDDSSSAGAFPSANLTEAGAPQGTHTQGHRIVRFLPSHAPDTGATAAPMERTAPRQDVPRPSRRLTFLPAPEATALPHPRPPGGAAMAGLADQVSAGVAPVLAQALDLTQAPAAYAPGESVRNTFNVNVHLDPSSAPAGLDRDALEDALIDLLRDTARRHGLEV